VFLKILENRPFTNFANVDLCERLVKNTLDLIIREYNYEEWEK
jgi:hypothetical protein